MHERSTVFPGNENRVTAQASITPKIMLTGTVMSAMKTVSATA